MPETTAQSKFYPEDRADREASELISQLGREFARIAQKMPRQKQGGANNATGQAVAVMIHAALGNREWASYILEKTHVTGYWMKELPEFEKDIVNSVPERTRSQHIRVCVECGLSGTHAKGCKIGALP